MRKLTTSILSWRTRWRAYEYVRNSLWIVPFVMVVLAITGGLLLTRVDERTTTTIGIHFGVDAARSVLGSIVGGMITFTGFVFSILLLAVQFGSSQFSPRLLRRFLRDPTTKAALGVFMATFVYALTVLRVVGTSTNENFVPDNSISVAVLLLVLSMLLFLRLISRTTQGLRVAAVLSDLGRDARRIIDKAYPDPAPDGVPADDTVVDGPIRMVSYAGRPGIVQSVDVRALIQRASTAGAVVELVPRFGDLVDDGYPLFRIHGDSGHVLDDAWLRGTVATGDERIMRQDPAFGFRLLADISAKALSPGVNDPTTATQALDQIELLLRQLGGRRLTPGVGRDRQGTVRLRYPVPMWEDYLRLAIDETRQYGETSVQVMRRLRALLYNVRDAVPDERKLSVDMEIAMLDSAVTRVFTEDSDRRAAVARDPQGLGAPYLARSD